MNDLLKQADRIPVTLVIAIAYVTLFVLTRGETDKETNELLHRYGVLQPIYLVLGEHWRLVAATFLHGDVIHLGMNTLALIALGPSLEMTLGSLRYSLLYLVAGLTGDIAVCLWYAPRGGVLGGSGALFGMLGAILAINMRAGRHPFQFFEHEGGRRFLGMIAIYLLIPLLIPRIPISNTGHVGGLLGGFLVTFLWIQPGRAPTRTMRQWRVALTALFASLLLWCLLPATRWDALSVRSEDLSGSQAAACRRAAAMAYWDSPTATETDYRRMLEKLQE